MSVRLSQSSVDMANALYAQLCASSQDVLLSQDAMRQSLDPQPSMQELMLIIQYLVDGMQLSVHHGEAGTSWKCVPQAQVARLKALNSEERMIYQNIEAVQNDGIWVRHLLHKTGLHKTVMDRCLKSLENKGFVKTVKNVQHATWKTYMLSHLTPAEDISGGPWYEDGELDVGFVEGLGDAIYNCIRERSFRKIKTEPGVSSQSSHSTKYIPYEAGYQGYPAITHIAQFLVEQDITAVPLLASDIQQVVDVLCWDGRVVKASNGGYRAVHIIAPTGKPADGLTANPCGACPVFEVCKNANGPVSPETCQYYDGWPVT